MVADGQVQASGEPEASNVDSRPRVMLQVRDITRSLPVDRSPPRDHRRILGARRDAV